MWLLMFKCRLRTFCSPFYKVGKACPDSCRIGIIATSESPQKQSINNIQLPIRSSVFNLSYVHIMQFMEMWLLMFKCRLRTFCSPFYKVGKACPDSCRIGIIATLESPQKQSINNIQLPIRCSVFNLSYVYIMQFTETWIICIN